MAVAHLSGEYLNLGGKSAILDMEGLRKREIWSEKIYIMVLDSKWLAR